jgi:hypothetical protein
LIRADLQNADLRRRRGEAHVQQGNWFEALADFAACCDLAARPAPPPPN